MSSYTVKDALMQPLLVAPSCIDALSPRSVPAKQKEGGERRVEQYGAVPHSHEMQVRVYVRTRTREDASPIIGEIRLKV